jgi:dipeptidyl aminopeptidase/acylaminoacyl peptidase
MMSIKMLILVFVFSYAFSSGIAKAQPGGTLLEQSPYRFPTYQEAVKTTDVEQETDKSIYENAVNDARFEFLRLKYASDGLKVVAYLYRPKQIEAHKFPTIVFNRPSAIRGDIAPELLPLFHRLADEGFVVIAPLLRQSAGGEGRDEIGGADLHDVMNVVPLARALGFVDLENLFMYGFSRGGMMTYLAIKEGFPLRAAASVGGPTDMRDVVQTHPQQYPAAMLKQFWPNFETQEAEIFQSRSAVFWPEKLNVPLLIMHGGNDRSVDPQQTLVFAQHLQKVSKTYELLIYAEDNHGLTRNREDRDRRVIEWFKRHLKK